VPVIFVVLFALDRHLGATVLIALMLWRFVGLLFRAKWSSTSANKNSWEDNGLMESEDWSINPATGLPVTGSSSFDAGGNLSGFGDDGS
jgi:hypothetical protein